MIEDVCLACLTRNNLFDMFKSSNEMKESNAVKLKNCFDIDLYPNTKINKICVNCIEQLNTAYKFKKQIVNAICTLGNDFATKPLSSINIELLNKIIELNNSINDNAMIINTNIDTKELINDKNEQKIINTNISKETHELKCMIYDTTNDNNEKNYIIDDTIHTREVCNVMLDNINEITERNFIEHDTITVTNIGNKRIHMTDNNIIETKASTFLIRDTKFDTKESNYMKHDTKHDTAEDTIHDNNVSNTVMGDTITNYMINDTKPTNNIIDDNNITDTDTNESTKEKNVSLFVDQTIDVGLNRVVGNPTEIDDVEEIFYCDYEESLENTLTIENTQDSYLTRNKEDHDVDIRIILDGDMYEEGNGGIHPTRGIHPSGGEGNESETNAASKSKRARHDYPPTKPYTLAEGQTKCDICQTECHRQKNLHTHMNTHYPTHPCHICDKKYASKERLTLHLRAHWDGNFQCKHCEKVFKNYNTCHSHMWRAHNTNSQFSCALCDAKFAKLSEKHAHMKSAHGLTDNAYECEECGKKFYSSDARSTHVRRVHRKISKKFRCAFCDQTFLQIKTLQRHTEKKHTDDKL